MISIFLAAAFTFTATATGIEKGAPVEFLFAEAGTDRDYETLFLIDGSVNDLCKRLEAAGLPRGKPVSATECRLWPSGCPISIDPPLGDFLNGKMPDGLPPARAIYTGGTRLPTGGCDAATNMPKAVFSVYTLAQAPILFDGIYDQGAVYNSYTAKDTLEKGKRYTFTVRWDASALPRSLSLTAFPGKSVNLLNRLRRESEQGQVDVTIGFDGDLTVAEARAVAQSLSCVDSVQIKINGCSNIFYRSFMPLVKWKDRRERLVQPFELTLGDMGTSSDELLFIEEDWNIEGDDPKLTPRRISFAEATRHAKTDTCFVYAKNSTKVSRVLASMQSLKGCKIRNWYVFGE